VEISWDIESVKLGTLGSRPASFGKTHVAVPLCLTRRPGKPPKPA
jgi:hypothetical protein